MEKSEKENHSLPSISIILPSFNEEKYLERRIKNCFEIDYPSLDKVIVVDDYSKDATFAIAEKLMKKYPLLEVTKNEYQKGKTGAVLTGIQKATSNLICVTDADVLFEKDTLEKISSYFQNPKVGIVCAALKPVIFDEERRKFVDIRDIWDSVYWFLMRISSRVDSTPLLHGQVFVFRKSTGILPEVGVRADDIDLPVKMRLRGFRSLFGSDAFFLEETITGVNDYSRRRRRSQGAIKALWKHKYLFFNPKYGLFGLFCYPLAFFLYFIQPILVFLLPFLIFIFLFLRVSFWVFGISLTVFLILSLKLKPLKDFFYVNGIFVRSVLKNIFGEDEISDSWETERN